MSKGLHSLSAPLTSLLDGSDGGRLIAAQAETALFLTPIDAGSATSGVRIFSDHICAPFKTRWPRGRLGHRLKLAGQLDFAALRQCIWDETLPSVGVLTIFVERPAAAGPAAAFAVYEEGASLCKPMSSGLRLWGRRQSRSGMLTPHAVATLPFHESEFRRAMRQFLPQVDTVALQDSLAPPERSAIQLLGWARCSENVDPYTAPYMRQTGRADTWNTVAHLARHARLRHRLELSHHAAQQWLETHRVRLREEAFRWRHLVSINAAAVVSRPAGLRSLHVFGRRDQLARADFSALEAIWW